jgi:hypothetical protein
VSGSTVYLGGNFSGANSINGTQTRNRLAAVDATTGTATGWDPNANNTVNALAVSGSTVYIGGDFSGANSINGTQTRNRLAAVDATTGTATAWDPGASDTVNALALDGGGGVIAGGQFTTLDLGAQRGVAAFGQAPAGTAAPQVSGTAAVGETVSCSQGGWSGSPPLSFAYQWLRDGAAIAGATASAYTITSTDVGHALSCQVTASNRDGGASATSAPLDVTAANPGGGGLRPTATTVSCTYSLTAFSDSCTATVRDAGAAPQSTPTGQVNISSSGGGSFSAASVCALAPSSPGEASCSVAYLPPAIGSPTITAGYPGDTLHDPSSGATDSLLATLGNGHLVTNLKVPNLFAAPSGPSLARRKLGATVRFTMRAPARVRFTVQKPRRGRPVRTLRGSFTLIAPKGSNKFRFRGRIGRKTLAPGRYRLVATPSIGPVKGKPTTATFKVKRP